MEIIGNPRHQISILDSLEHIRMCVCMSSAQPQIRYFVGESCSKRCGFTFPVPIMVVFFLISPARLDWHEKDALKKTCKSMRQRGADPRWFVYTLLLWHDNPGIPTT